MIKGILTSIGITFLVSSGVAYFLTSFNISFVKSFIFTTAVQFVLFYFYNEFKRTRISKFAVEKLSETELNFEQSGADVVCANCKKEVFAPIELPEPNNFTCPHCGSENSIYLNIETAVVTRPV